MIDEIRELESEKREAALEAERAKIAELEISIEQLKAVSIANYIYIREKLCWKQSEQNSLARNQRRAT